PPRARPRRRRAEACRPPDARRSGAGSRTARRTRETASSSCEESAGQTDVDACGAYELRHLDVLDVGVRAGADGAVIDGRDPGRAPERAVRDHLPPDRLERVPGHVRVRRLQRADELVLWVDAVLAAHEPEVELDLAARLACDGVEQSPVLRLDRGERVAGRPAASADD